MAGKAQVMGALALAALTAIATEVAWPPVTDAQVKYPERPVRIIVPAAAGGIPDVTIRLVGDKLGAKLGQRFVVENVPGAGGAAAARTTLAAPADGYTLTLLTNATAISVPLFKHLSFDPLKDFVPVSSIGYFDGVFVTNAASQYKTLGDFLAAARAKPGALNVGTINVGSTQNLSAELLKSLAGANFVIIPFRTTPEAVTALMRDDVQMVVDFPSALKAGLTDHKLLPVAATGPVSARALGGVPTVAEAGVPGYEVRSWSALYAPAATPKADIDVLNAALRLVLDDPDLRKRAAELGIETHAGTAAEIDAQLRGDIEKWSRLIEDAKIPKQ
ncbi:MAG TPA: tripartite tricarboxylate transporter substrate-binding protein [Xanthobacteraceae bacterium]|nr:tripartite tricarboxylate transporter substrate-binding protein [Xanthobacteraceae bacterium]